MIRAKIVDKLKRIHFYLVGFALFNFALKSVFEVSLNYKLAYIINLSIYASGIFLFFQNIKPFKKIVIYYGYYIVSLGFTLFFTLFGGIFFAISTAIVSYPIFSNEIKIESKTIAIYAKFQGFLGACCPYEVTEKKHGLFEKKIMELNFQEEIDFNNTVIVSENGKLELKFTINDYDDETNRFVEKDTIVKIQTE